MSAPFAVIVPGRQVDVNFVRTPRGDDFINNLEHMENAHHIVVFLTGLVPISSEYFAAVYINMYELNKNPSWIYLGKLTTEKPSAIYKILNLLATNKKAEEEAYYLIKEEAGPPLNSILQVRINMERVGDPNELTPVANIDPSIISLFEEFTVKTVTNLFNYVSSFGKMAKDLPSNPFNADDRINQIVYVPISTIQEWYFTFTRKQARDENYWRTLN